MLGLRELAVWLWQQIRLAQIGYILQMPYDLTCSNTV